MGVEGHHSVVDALGLREDPILLGHRGGFFLTAAATGQESGHQDDQRPAAKQKGADVSRTWDLLVSGAKVGMQTHLAETGKHVMVPAAFRTGRWDNGSALACDAAETGCEEFARGGCPRRRSRRPPCACCRAERIHSSGTRRLRIPARGVPERRLRDRGPRQHGGSDGSAAGPGRGVLPRISRQGPRIRPRPARGRHSPPGSRLGCRDGARRKREPRPQPVEPGQ